MKNDLQLSSLPRILTCTLTQLGHTLTQDLYFFCRASVVLLVLSLFFTSVNSLAQLTPVELERHCIEEAQPQGLSVAVDAQRQAHLFFFSAFNELIHITLSELSGELTSQREILKSFNSSSPVLAHTRSTRTAQGIATCYMDPDQQGIVVHEQQGDQTQSSLAISSLGLSYCDIVSENDILWLSAVVNGELIVARGDAQYNLDQEQIGRSWTQEVAVPFTASGYNAVVRSGDNLWAASQAGATSLFLASRPIDQVNAWTVTQLHAVDGQAFGERLHLSARNADFNGQIWATHGRATSHPILNSDRGFLVTEIYEGAWDSYDPIANLSAGVYHDAFAGPMRDNEEGYLYVLTRSHLRSSIFGNSDALMLLRYQSSTSNPNTQYLEGPLSGTGKIFTELAMSIDPLAELMAFSHHYDDLLGQLCRWSAPDQDHDGLPNAFENQIGTFIDQSDSDQDGKSDGEEVLVSGTDPLSPNLPPATCDDQIKNGLESDTDCGGPSCPSCSTGSTCFTDQDCLEQQCLSQVCVTPSCEDGVQNRDESDVDCGGQNCSPCSNGSQCQANQDCLSNLCLNQICVNPSCDDNIRNQDESDIDCGGTLCEPCTDRQRCEIDRDCFFNQCLLNICVPPSCDDGVRGIGESDIDCGGLICAQCLVGQRCTSHADCASRRCAVTLNGKVCVAPSCDDLTQNGDETDTDCGGSCPACPPNYACNQKEDCQSFICQDRLCSTPNCEDGVQNRDESDTDCGGQFCQACDATALCNQDSDCQSQHCLGGLCAEATCSDQRLNQNELEVDCGGVCSPCPGALTDMMIIQDMDLESDMMPSPDMFALDMMLIPDMMPVPDMFNEQDMGSTQDMLPDPDYQVIMLDQSTEDPTSDMFSTSDMNILNIDDMTQSQTDSAANREDQGMGEINAPPPTQTDNYDPSVFTPKRPESGCDLSNTGSISSRYERSIIPPAWLILCLLISLGLRQYSMFKHKEM